MRPMRVMKGKKLSGHMGVDTVTVQNLTIVDVNLEDNYILVSGNIPGAKESLVLIRPAVKGGNKEIFELVSYEEVKEEPIEEVKETLEVEENVSETSEENAKTNEETPEEVVEESTEEVKPEEVETTTEEEK